jgi:hypothetical protein
MNASTTDTAITTIATVRRVAMVAIAGLTAGGLAVAAGVPAQAAVARDLDARMRATPTQPQAHGHAELDADRTGREFEVRVAGLKGLAGHRLTVRVHGDVVGKMTVRRTGRAHLDRKAGVPAMSAGDVVKVRTSSGTVVSRGTLHRETESDRGSDG